MRASPCRRFGSIVWIVIFAFKPIVVGTMIAYDQLELASGGSGADGHQWTQFDAQGQPGRGINYDDVPFDDRVAA